MTPEAYVRSMAVEANYTDIIGELVFRRPSISTIITIPHSIIW